jgi:hypothetical protein
MGLIYSIKDKQISLVFLYGIIKQNIIGKTKLVDTASKNRLAQWLSSGSMVTITTLLACLSVGCIKY